MVAARPAVRKNKKRHHKHFMSFYNNCRVLAVILIEDAETSIFYFFIHFFYFYLACLWCILHRKSLNLVPTFCNTFVPMREATSLVRLSDLYGFGHRLLENAEFTTSYYTARTQGFSVLDLASLLYLSLNLLPGDYSSHVSHEETSQ